MKYCLIVPTFLGHINQVDIFLSSFNDNAIDKLEIPIKLIISENEFQQFQNMIQKYDFDIELISLKKIISYVEKIDINEIELLNKIQKFNFQSIKKLYAVKYFDSNLSLVIDSEALLIRKIHFKSIFENYLNRKLIFHSKHHKKDPLQINVTNNVFKILNNNFIDAWFFDYQYWFYENYVINDLFNSLDNLFELLCNIKPIFEYNLYSAFIYLNNKYNYEFIDVDLLLSKKMSFLEYQNYLNSLKSGTLFEYLSWHLSNFNYEVFCNIFKEYNLMFFKYDDRFLTNQDIQQKFLENNKQICLIVCRVICQSFEINSFKIPINHNYMTNQPILF